MLVQILNAVIHIQMMLLHWERSFYLMGDLAARIATALYMSFIMTVAVAHSFLKDIYWMMTLILKVMCIYGIILVS